jgi:protein SCO1/2
MAAGAALLSAVALPRARADESGGNLAKPARELSAGAGTRQQDAPSAVIRTVEDYQVPSIPLVRDDGRRVTLVDELDDGRAVVLNFIYTTCSGICPLASQIFSELQRELGAERDRVHLVSISVDPEEDTPARLRAYARQYSAGPAWQHYTGTVAASIAAQRAFDVYRGDKMGHTPVTLVRRAPGAAWVRFDGFATPDVLMKELRRQLEPATASATH